MPGTPSPLQIPIPATDLLSYVFPANTTPSANPLWIDAADPTRSLSLAQALVWIKRIGVWLQRLGLQQGDVVLVLSTNHIFVPVAYLGIAGNGFIYSGANPSYTADEVAYQIRDTGAALMLVDPVLVDAGLAGARKAGFSEERMYLFDDSDCCAGGGEGVLEDWRAALPSAAEAAEYQWTRQTAAHARSRTAILNYSSGTTGLPKGVMISAANVIANVEQSLYVRRLRSADPASLVDAAALPAERWLSFLPLYHAYGQLWAIGAAARAGVPVYMMRRFEFGAFLGYLERYGITHLQTAPPVVVLLAKRPEVARYDLSALRNILCGAAPLSRELQREVMAALRVTVTQTWGMTELTCSATHVPGLAVDESGCVGVPVANSVVKLVDDDGRTVVAEGERGELCVQGPHVCLGYWRNAEATRAAWDDEGFLRSGDIAVREGGYYRIVDRKKELIKVKGFQVAPAELEGVLMENADVADAAVVGVRGDHGEELPRAYVVLAPPARARGVAGADVARWLEARVARHKWLTGGVAVVDEVPKSPSGKIQRRELREWAARDRAGVVRARL